MTQSEITDRRWTENEILERLRAEGLLLPPARLRLCSEQVPVTPPTGRHQRRAGGILEAAWQGRVAQFVFEYKGANTPMAIDGVIAQVRQHSNALKLHPLIIVPYLSEASLRRLEAEGISGIDLNGNGILLAPEMVIWRSGEPNRYKTSQPIRNVYRGVSSLVARSFLLQPTFASLVDLQNFARGRLAAGQSGALEPKLTKGTVSKVVQVLVEEKIVFREEGGLRLLDSRMLLDNLRNNYLKPRLRRVTGRTPLAIPEAWERLNTSGIRCVSTGDGSAGHYRVLSHQDKLSLYVEDFDRAVKLLEIEHGRVFPNVELIEETSDVVYFDARKHDPILWASPIQTWIELSLGGPREKEAAREFEAVLLQGKGQHL